MAVLSMKIEEEDFFFIGFGMIEIEEEDFFIGLGTIEI